MTISVLRLMSIQIPKTSTRCTVLLIHRKLNDFTALLLSAGILSTSTCNDAIECIYSLESCLPAHAMLPPSLIQAIFQMAHANKQQTSKRKVTKTRSWQLFEASFNQHYCKF